MAVRDSAPQIATAAVIVATAAATPLVGANPGRRALIVSRVDVGQPIFIGGVAVTAGSGLRLDVSSLILEIPCCAAAVSAIATGADQAVTIMEVF